MATVPYAEEQCTSQPRPSGSRLVIALSCIDPMQRVHQWSMQSIDLTDVSEVSLGRGEAFALVRAQFGGEDVVTISIPDMHLSSRHMRLARAAADPEASTRWVVHDARSTNGTWVNGVRRGRNTLANNDVIAVGATILLYRQPAENATTPQLASGDGDAAPDIDELRTLNPELSRTVTVLRQLAPSRLPMLICGQTGVGKEVMARASHRLSGRTGPFVAAAVPAPRGHRPVDRADAAHVRAGQGRYARVSRQAGAQLFMYEWPKNVRELNHALHAAALLSVYREHQGNRAAIARALGTSRSQVQRLLLRYDVAT